MLAPIAVFLPRVEFVLIIVDDPRATSMIQRPYVVDAPFGECRTTDAQILSGFCGSKFLSDIGDHAGHPGVGDSPSTKMAIEALAVRQVT
jgi:hypothetical protein